MASIKILKKNLNYITRELIAECLTYKHFHADVKQEKFDKAVASIIENHNELIQRCGKLDRKAGKKAIKAHFQTLRKDFEKSLNAMDSLAE